MPVIFQKFIYREDLQKNRNVLYLFGDNCERIGHGGQAKEMRGEPNAVGIRTKRDRFYNNDSYLSDTDFDEVKLFLFEDFDRPLDFLKKGGIVVVPSDGLGTGLAKLHEKAPLILEEIEAWIDTLKKA